MELKKLRKGIKPLSETHPELKEFWDYEKNLELGYTMDNISSGSGKSVYWKCAKHGGYTKKVYRSLNGDNCQLCKSGSLYDIYPEIADLWHPTLNGGLMPNNVFSRSNKEFWWLCPIHGEYQQVLDSKVNSNHSCPYCSGRRVHSLNCLTATHPEIAKLWHPTLNGDLTPNDVTYGSEKKVWWLCPIHGEYEQEIYIKTYENLACPYCSGRKVHELTCLKATNPEIAKLWHPTLNEDLTPNDVTYGSGKKVWWLCPIHGEYEQVICDKMKGTGCPYCSGRKVHELTCLKATHPEIAKEWHPTLNGDLTPNDVTAGSNKKVWWLCSIHGKYKKQVCKKVGEKLGCPYCDGKKVHPLTSLMTIYPEIAKEWHPTLNGDLTPNDVTYGSGKKVWWLCPIHGEYEQRVKSRSYKGCGMGCPKCSESKGEKRIAKYLKEKNIKKIHQKKFKEELGNKRFDFYLPKLNLLIEYDGEFHFEIRKLSKNAKKNKIDFIKRKESDKIKNQFAKDNQIPLLRIPYWEFDNVESIIDEVLSKFNSLDSESFYKYISNKTIYSLNSGKYGKVIDSNFFNTPL